MENGKNKYVPIYSCKHCRGRVPSLPSLFKLIANVVGVGVLDDPQIENSTKIVANVVGGAAHSDPKCIEEITRRCRGELRSPDLQRITKI